MKPKLNKNLSLPWTPQGEKASGNEFPHLPNIISLSGFVFPGVLYQSLTSPTVLLCRFMTTVINTSTSLRLRMSESRY